MGYLSLDSNERSNFQARELKTVYIDYVGKFIRLIIHDNYINKQNLYNQVGIVAVNFLGNEETISSMLAVNNNSNSSNRPSNGYRDPTVNSLNDLSIDMNLDPTTATKLRLLADAKQRAINTEDYVTAKQIKSIEGDLKVLGSRLAQLDIAKRQSIEVEDYDRAKEIKEETDELRKVIEKKIYEINIPGVTDTRPMPVAPRYPTGSNSSYPRSTTNRNNDEYEDDFVPEVPTGGSGNRGINIDELPVGNRRAAEMDEQYEDDGNDNSYNAGLAHGDRPIRPKEKPTYDDRDPDLGEEEEPSRFKDEKFAPGQHPLEGVENLSELPTPEDLVGKSRDMSEQSGITGLIGEYRSRCLFSKVWALREAAITKVQMMLGEYCDENPGINNCLPALCAIVRLGVEDKSQHILLNTVQLMEEFLGYSRKSKVPRSTLAPLMDPVITSLIEKLHDGNARIREGAKKGTEALASSSNIGCPVVGAHALRPLPAKQKTAWRPIMTRLQLLTDLVNTHGIGGNSGLSVDNIMTFAKNYGAFAHSNGEVRDACKDLTIACQKIVGTPALESYLKLLRPKQLEEYIAAFDGGGNVSGGNSLDKISAPERAAAPKKANAPSNDRKGAPASPRNAKHGPSGHSHSPAGKVNTAAARAADKDGSLDEPTDFTTCMFCGKSDKGWNEDALDLHYWQECPLLAPCPACAQVVEIAGLPEHLLEECEYKANFTSCEVTGLAIRKSDYAAWKSSPNCVAAPSNCMYCPLCKTTVDDSDDAWKNHLVRDCTQNTRTRS